jgi:hypothetical protein
MAREPLKFYRLWCGPRRWSSWEASARDAMLAGVPHGVTYRDGDGIAFGPLAWIEVGQRRYPKSKTVSLGRG